MVESRSFQVSLAAQASGGQVKISEDSKESSRDDIEGGKGEGLGGCSEMDCANKSEIREVRRYFGKVSSELKLSVS